MQAEEAPWEAESQDSQSSYNDSTQEPRSQEFRKIYGEEDGADWWKTAAQEEARMLRALTNMTMQNMELGTV